MRYAIAFALSSAAALAVATPLDRRAVTAFPKGMTWDIVLHNEGVDLKKAVGQALDIDLDDNSEEGDTTIKDLAKTKKIICYFSAGSVEDWRNDYPDFLPEDIGQPMKDWPGEWWLNVNSPNVKAIMKKRIERAAKAGCHAVDPDNVDGYGSNHQDGFTYPQADYVEYMKYLADLAHQNNMAIGLKNAVEIIPALVSTVDFFVNEQCHNLDFNECWKYKPATDAGKAVFNIEYGGNNCTEPVGVDLSEVIKPADQKLNTLGGQCA